MSNSKSIYNFMLLGKVGSGKSSTGNTLLNQTFFKTSCSFKSCTQNVVKESNEFSHCIFNVIDTPGIYETNKNTEETVKIIYEGMAHFPEGFNALLFVLKLGDRSTQELVETVHILKAVFGDSQFKEYCIICLTFGDLFEGLNNGTIQEWCKNEEDFEKGSELWTLLRECNYRVVLFDNAHKDKRQESVQKLLSYIDPQAPRYTNEHFQKCAEARDAYMTSLGFPEQRAKIHVQICLLQLALERELNVGKILLKVDALLKTIEIESKGTNSLDDLKKRVIELKSEIEELPEEEKQKATALEKVKKVVNLMKFCGTASAVAVVGLSTAVACTAVGTLSVVPGVGLCCLLGVTTIGPLIYSIYVNPKCWDSTKNKKEDGEKLFKKY